MEGETDGDRRDMLEFRVIAVRADILCSRLCAQAVFVRSWYYARAAVAESARWRLSGDTDILPRRVLNDKPRPPPPHPRPLRQRPPSAAAAEYRHYTGKEV